MNDHLILHIGDMVEIIFIWKKRIGCVHVLQFGLQVMQIFILIASFHQMIVIIIRWICIVIISICMMMLIQTSIVMFLTILIIVIPVIVMSLGNTNRTFFDDMVIFHTMGS
jgi:hypothetical protein